MIWTEEENEIRKFENMINSKGKNCANCQWSIYEKGDEMTICGHHIENFSINSFCTYWTAKDDPKVKAYMDKRKRALKVKLDKLKNEDNNS